MTRAATGTRARSLPARTLPDGYLARSQMPLVSLALLLPMIVLYEAGTRWFAYDPSQQTEQRIIAFTLMQRFFEVFGATGRYLPALAVVGILLAWHIARNDPWQVSPKIVGGMIIEATAWALPLLALGIMSARYIADFLPLMIPSGDVPALLVLSIGAGIYEELVFRLIGMTLLSVLLIDLLKMPKTWGYLLMVLITSFAFAFYHYLGYETFGWRSFAFRSLAGVYFGVLFLWRGFGITACTHTAYDIIVVALLWRAPS